MSEQTLSILSPESGAPSTATEVSMPAHVARIVPFTAYDAYHRLSLEQQTRVSTLLEFFAEMSNGRLVETSRRIAALNPGRGFSDVNLRSLYYKFRHAEKAAPGTGWRVLAKIYRGPEKLPAEFVQEVRKRIEANSVSSRAAIVELKAEWASGASIPGYGTWREFHATMYPERDVPDRFPLNFYPQGWSESNLYTKQSTKAERELKRRGYIHAHRYLPHVVRDTSKLRPLQLIVIDDFEIDQLVQAWNPDTKRWQICRCSGLLAMDVATRRKLAMGLKPRFTDDEGKKIAITRADVQSLLYAVFSEHGLPAEYGCTILCENAAAAITGEFETVLQALLGVQVARTGLLAERTLKNGFVQSGGKPYEKGWIESGFRLMHSTAGALIGQKGANYILKPADLEAKVLYSEKLLNLDGLAEDVLAQLRTPFMKSDDILVAYERIFARMEDRHDHKLQGFDQRFVYRLPDGSGDVEQHELPATLTTEQILKLDPIPWMESPRERWEKLMPQVRRVKVAPHILACLLLTPKKLTLKTLKLTFAHQGVGYTYSDADSKVMREPDGSELLGFFDPARPNILYVTDLKGGFIDKVRRRGAPVDILDHDALSAEQAEVSRLIHKLVRQPVAERHAGENAQLANDDAHNVRLQIDAGIEKPVRMQPLPAPATRPSASSTAQPGHNGEPTASGAEAADGRRANLSDKQPVLNLSRRLARPHQLARDCFAVGEQLASAIAADVTAGDQRAALERQIRSDAETLTADEIAAANTTERPEDDGQSAERSEDKPFSNDEISDLLRD